MKVADIMRVDVDYVSTTDSIRDVARLIFGHGINGVPVVKDRKLVGFITERDILSRFYPTMQDYIDDPVHAGDFEAMEERVSEIFDIRAEEIMSRNPTAVIAETPLLRAQSTMFVHKIGRLPVVDKSGNLIGLISKGDIFRALVGDKLPLALDEEYHDWLSKHYDLVQDWGKRLGKELPELVELFRKEKVRSVLDVGCGTGEHSIALAKEGFQVLGLEGSNLMYQAAVSKQNTLPKAIAKNITFANGSYKHILGKQKQEFDAAIFMGNALPHIVNDYEDAIKAVANSLGKNGVVVLQVINFFKVFNTRGRFLDINFAKSKMGINTELGFLEFYDPPRRKDDPLTLTMAVFSFNGKKWYPRDINSVSIAELDHEDIEKLLKKYGFSSVKKFGSLFNGPLFSESFDSREHDWLNIVARR